MMEFEEEVVDSSYTEIKRRVTPRPTSCKIMLIGRVHHILGLDMRFLPCLNYHRVKVVGR
jgi:hypothetical protein